jgi:redox-sensitive bicupin YhaK (pirin superfamily)
MIDLVIPSRQRDLGGFEVGRILPFPTHRMVGPFIFLDHMGPADFAPGHGIDVRPHPHIGLSTLTYLFEGRIFHCDSLGFAQAITPGEVNWMTAGRGIVHSERTEPDLLATGGAMHGMQAWIALPNEDEEIDPAFANHKAEDLPTYQTGGMWARLVAGSAYGTSAKVKTHSPLFYIHWELEPGTKAGLPGEYSERAVFIVEGSIDVDGRSYEAGQMLVFAKGAEAVVTAVTLGGEPVGQRYIWWNLVSSSRERIAEAKAYWKAGRMTLPPGDDHEFIPAPEDVPLP